MVDEVVAPTPKKHKRQQSPNHYKTGTLNTTMLIKPARTQMMPSDIRTTRPDYVFRYQPDGSLTPVRPCRPATDAKPADKLQKESETK